MTIHIEICKSEYKKGTWKIRIGDLKGNIELSSAPKEDIISEIRDAMLREEVVIPK